MIYNKKYIIIIIIFILSLIYAYPNIYGEDPVIAIKIKNTISENLIKEKIAHIKYKSIKSQNKELIIRFNSTEDQFNTFEELNKIKDIELTQNILASDKTKFLTKINAYPMKLGLDLRGGIQLTIQINTNKLIENKIKHITNKLKKILDKKNIKINVLDKKNIKINIPDIINKNKYIDLIQKISANYFIIKSEDNAILLKLDKKYKTEIKNNIINKTLSVLTNRINELGISETVIYKHGKKQIIIEIPGIQNIEYAKTIIGKTATLNFMLLANKNKTQKIKIFNDKNENKIALKNKSILNGNSIIYATMGFENISNKPCVNIKIDKKKAVLLNKVTTKHLGKPMAITYKETLTKNKTETTKEYIISIANIMSPLGEQFQITGLNIDEAKNLAILLRAGSLPADISIIEEKLIGPSLGENNIKESINSLIISILAIFSFMIIRYKKLGIISNITLIYNITLMISIMSLIGFTLTLSGIAGIILTIGMSIDSNILIFERIKEEKQKITKIDHIVTNGFNNALASILDANITTLIMALILFTIGSGPIKGFALALSLGILTSIYSSLIVTKSIINFLIEKKIKII